jgi:phosphatidylserine/phosphatidylglycerophosphate/cardiolipin synthase-like enzyme
MVKKTILTIIIIITLFAEVFSQNLITIDSVRKQDANGVPLLLNQVVKVRGVVTTSGELGTPLIYFQVPSAGLVAYDAVFGAAVNRGDSVEVTGTVVHYNGLTELQPVSSYTVLSTGITTPLPLVVTPTQIRENGELYEGRLIRINGITQVKTSSGAIATQWTVTSSGTNYRIFVGTDSCDIRIYASTNIANTTIPPFPFTVIALNSQYKTSSPYFGGYQIIPRDLNDFIITAGGPIIAAAPVESNITTSSITLSFTTLSAGDTKIKYFLSDSLNQPEIYTDSVYLAAQTTEHSVTLNNLKPGRIYSAYISSTNTSGTSVYNPKVFSTASHPSSTGKIEVYFNFPADTSVALPNNKANGNTDFRIRLGNRIDSATYSVDMAIYSFNEITIIRDKLINAMARGVKIRIVYDHRDGNIQALMQDLINAGIKVIQRPVGSYIMHNKFLVFDARDTSAHSKKWIWAGSANITNDQFFNDVQNVILIQDESLANAYTREFEEMWGSHNDNFNTSLAKFGSQKGDNTPHIFNINGKKIECYFSPSDNVSSKIENLILNQTNKSINFLIFAFTRYQIANRMKTKYNPPSVMVRGVFDYSNNMNSNLYLEMKGQGTQPWNPAAKVYLDTYNNSLLHSKYMIIDADNLSSNPVVETGSYNYSDAATSGNDENILIIYDSLVANSYYQDFVKRLTDAGGTIDVKKISDIIPKMFKIEQNYPNPFNPETIIKMNIAGYSNVKLIIYDILGRELVKLMDGNLDAGSYNVKWNASGYPSGIYFVKLITDGKSADVKKMVLKK